MGFAEVQPVIDHLSQLQRAGLSMNCISQCSGISRFSIVLISRGERRRVFSDTAEKLLSVKVSDILRSGDAAQIPSTGTTRRLRALHAIGYSGTVLADHLGHSPTLIRELLTGSNPLVRASTARAVAALFDALEVRPLPPSRSASRAMNRARRLGWAVPLQWDVDSIDDPAARPIKGNVQVEDWLPEYEKLRARAYSQKKIAEAMGIHPKSLQSRLRRLEAAV